jgi:hypothetical protein
MDAAIKETLADLTQKQALELCRRLWREPVWDLKIVAGRILARKSIEPDDGVWAFVTERLAPTPKRPTASTVSAAPSARPTARPQARRDRRHAAWGAWRDPRMDGPKAEHSRPGRRGSVGYRWLRGHLP